MRDGEEVSQEVVGEGETFDFKTGYGKEVWVEVEEDGKPVGEGGMTGTDGVAKINLTKAGKYTVLIKDKKDGELLKKVSLIMLEKLEVEEVTAVINPKDSTEATITVTYNRELVEGEKTPKVTLDPAATVAEGQKDSTDAKKYTYAVTGITQNDSNEERKDTIKVDDKEVTEKLVVPGASTTKTNEETTNTQETLGLVGTEETSSDEDVETVEITGEAKNGDITIGTITKAN